MRVRNQFYRLMSPDPDPAAGAAPPAAAPSPDPAAPNPDPAPAAAPAADPAAPASTWPDDWRTQIAGTDEKLLGKISRYSSPKDIANALISVQGRIGSGELRSSLPKNATEEQTKTWREENGIPETPDKYDLKLEGGLVVGEDDKALIGDLLKAVHKAHGNSTMASEVVNFYYSEVEKQEAARHAKDADLSRAASDELHAEWGAEFRPNLNGIEALMDMAPAGVKDLFKFGRLSDGTPIMGHAPTIRWLSNLAREINPITAVIPNAGADIAASIDAEIKKIEANMGAPKGSAAYKAYWEDTKAQARWRELDGARARAKEKGSRA